MSDIQTILTDLGYSPVQDKDGFRMAAIYRQGDNSTALKVYNDFWCQDFVTGERFTLETLIKRTLNIDDNKVKEYINGKNISLERISHIEKLKIPEIFDKEILKDLIPDYTYFIGRGISKETCEVFKGGLCLESSSILGKLKNRQVLNVYDSKGNLVAFTGRSLDDRKPKWKHLGSVTNTIFPAYLNGRIIKELREVVLVESPLDCLRCWDMGIKNVISLFGVECSFPIVNYLLKINPKKIFISTNNEQSQVGNRATDKIFARLKKYFSLNQIRIYLPPCKDFCECSNEQIREWHENRYN